jgi:hypothetical protein
LIHSIIDVYTTFDHHFVAGFIATPASQDRDTTVRCSANLNFKIKAQKILNESCYVQNSLRVCLLRCHLFYVDKTGSQHLAKLRRSDIDRVQLLLHELPAPPLPRTHRHGGASDHPLGDQHTIGRCDAPNHPGTQREWGDARHH